MADTRVIDIIKESKDCINLVTERGYNLYIRNLSEKANKIIYSWITKDKIDNGDLDFLSDFTFKVTNYDFNKRLKQLYEADRKEFKEDIESDSLLF